MKQPHHSPIIGVDLARPGGDKSAICEVRKNADGTLTVIGIGTWGREDVIRTRVAQKAMREYARQRAALGRRVARDKLLRAVFGVR